MSLAAAKILWQEHALETHYGCYKQNYRVAINWPLWLWVVIAKTLTLFGHYGMYKHLFPVCFSVLIILRQ